MTGRKDAYALDHALQTLREHYPRPFFESCLNLISSHDIIRAATALSGAPDRNSVSRKLQAAYKPNEQDQQNVITSYSIHYTKLYDSPAGFRHTAFSRFVSRLDFR